MALSLGIVGLPNVGKSSLFNALTDSRAADAQNYPFTTIDPNVGVVTVPDERLVALANIVHTKKIVHATVEFVDIAGLVKGANKGEGLGNQFLANIREVDAIVEVVRAFDSDDVIHVEGSPNPMRDFEIIETELILKDLDVLERRWDKVHKEAAAGLAGPKALDPVLTSLRDSLRRGVPARNVLRDIGEGSERDMLILEMKDMALLTAKPLLVLINAQDGDDADAAAVALREVGVSSVRVDVKEELDAAGLTTKERTELGIGSVAALDSLIDASYRLLGLISFLTAGEMEARAWTIHKGTKAPAAAGVIHTDFEKTFIKMDAIDWEKFVEAGGWKKAREQGEVRSEGKEYVVSDGDVVEIKHG